LVLQRYSNGNPAVLQRYSNGTPAVLQRYSNRAPGVQGVSLFPPCYVYILCFRWPNPMISSNRRNAYAVSFDWYLSGIFLIKFIKKKRNTSFISK
jgi:hypothetical protein